MQLVAPQPYEVAIQKLGARSPVGSLLNSTEWRDVPVALRETAFFSSQVENVRFLQRAQDALKDYLAGAKETITRPDGSTDTVLKTGSRAAFVDQMRKFAQAEGMGPLNPKDAGTIKDITAEGRLALIFDTQTRAAREFGRYKQGMDPAVLDEFPAQKLIRVRRVKKPRSYHQAALGEVRLKTDTAYWVGLNPDFGVPWGPWGFNSGCDVEDVDRAGAEGRKLLKPNQKVRPVDKKFTDSLQASLLGLDPALVNRLKLLFGADATVENGAIRWTGQAAPKPKPAPKPKAEAEPKSPAELLARLKIDPDAPKATAEQMRALAEALAESKPRTAADVLVDVTGASHLKNFVAADLRGMVSGYLRFLPPEVTDGIGKFKLEVHADLPGALGDYNEAERRLRLNASRLDDDATGLKKTLWHEMIHWSHDHGPAEFRARLETLFAKRTAGFTEQIVGLPPYGPPTTGYEDDWKDANGDAYAGRVYPWEKPSAPRGYEIATRHLEKLALAPDVLARHWNYKSPKTGNYAWREAFIECLNLFFAPPAPAPAP